MRHAVGRSRGSETETARRPGVYALTLPRLVDDDGSAALMRARWGEEESRRAFVSRSPCTPQGVASGKAFVNYPIMGPRQMGPHFDTSPEALGSRAADSTRTEASADTSSKKRSVATTNTNARDHQHHRHCLRHNQQHYS